MMQKVISRMLKAITEFNMIEENDKIAIGLSGGKDSIVLLQALNRISKFYDKHFEIMAITIDSGLNNLDISKLKEMCDSLNIEYIVYKSHINEIVFDIRKEKNPCSLCSNLRKGMLNSIAKEHSCNKLALGHHKDDVIETFLMSQFYNGSIHTFAPVTKLSRTDMIVIRPMVYVEEKYTRALAKKRKLSCCS